jgi:hypothetical protein
MGIQFVGACCLPFQTQGFNNCPVTVDIFELHIVEQSSAPSDQHQQSSAGMMILLVDFQMFGKIGDSVGQKSNLHFRRSRIGLVQFKFFDQLLLIFCCESHFLFCLLLFISEFFARWFQLQRPGFPSKD